ncbi:MAG: DUF1461 domain-containing protein [Eggerthellaceae bacterium]|jgi:hypothetical protein
MAGTAYSQYDPSSTASLPRVGRSTAGGSILAAVIVAVCVAYWLIAIGFFCCCINPTTWLLSTMTSDYQTSPYSQSQLVELAQATRAYTVEGMDADDLYAAIGKQAKKLTTATIQRQTGEKTSIKGMSDAEVGKYLGEHCDTLSHPQDAMEHLDQVHAVVVGAFFILLFTLVIGIIGIAFLLKRSRISLARALIGAGAAILILFAAAGIWAASDFDSLFATLHSLFFAAGTWTFSADSLLICQYPEKFWTAMGIVWGAVTVIACLVTLSIGSRTKRNA